MNDLWSHLHSLPDDDDCRFGVEQVSPRTVKYVVGTRIVLREDLLTMCMLHLCFIEGMEVRFSGAAAGEHGSPIRYSRKARDAEGTIREVVNRVQHQNGVAGSGVPLPLVNIYDLSSVFWYPRRWGLRPSPDAYRRGVTVFLRPAEGIKMGTIYNLTLSSPESWSPLATPRQSSRRLTARAATPTAAADQWQ